MNDAASAASSEREKFEAWLHDNFGKRSIVRAPDGYAHSVAHAALPSTYASVQMLWEAWQAACRAQATSPTVVEPLTDEAITAAARVLCERQADACGIDRDDQWMVYGDGFKEDARAMLIAAHGIGIKKGEGNGN